VSGGNDLFPLFVKLRQVDTLVVGGGKVGLEKVMALLGNDPLATLKIVALTASTELKDYIRPFPQVVLEERAFRMEDLEGKHLVICATGDPALNEQVRAAASDRKLLLNIADTPDLCDFYLASIVRKGNLKIAFSTNGKSPTLAKRLREYFNEVFPDEIDDLLLHLTELRSRMKGDLPEKIRQLDKLTRLLLEEPGASNDLL
jgi:siroheme synthase-like protein